MLIQNNWVTFRLAQSRIRHSQIDRAPHASRPTAAPPSVVHHRQRQHLRTDPERKMAERRRIAIAIDSSEYAENAFDWYMQYLHHPQNELLCIHVPEGFDVNKAQKELAKGGVMKETTERVYSKITELEERYHHKLHHHQVRGTVLSVPSKSPGQTIIDTANEERCFAIVIGTKGRSKIQKALMGSVSDYVLKNSNVPVIIVKKKRAKDDK